ncbi:hypothetical protein PPL_11699 [Heterostelium album PN500]|uniref:Uncharacterized protein n=1 Tax=Heterostelium pallidum (strain ATCC 26659 / Pp 5 / PN500) TaxID=670386 RepID=D3BU80_HETP5|nr:hypothetical protein PPL_11699 [Heterostelium album PN500]EFA75014.1 hypothetical protein PPL_11699 [Heterostelium album PN500]|eukprot:XP_020427148.1 hypothetical protein PPL_11699 [Heterostelium album PN500]
MRIATEQKQQQQQQQQLAPLQQQQQQNEIIIEFENVSIQRKSNKLKYLAKNMPHNYSLDEFIKNVECSLALSVSDVVRVDKSTLSFSITDQRPEIQELLSESGLKIKKQFVVFEKISVDYNDCESNGSNNSDSTANGADYLVGSGGAANSGGGGYGRIKISGLNVNQVEKTVISTVFNFSMDIDLPLEAIEVCNDAFVVTMSEENCASMLAEGNIIIQRVKATVSPMLEINLLLVIQEPILEVDSIASLLNNNFGLTFKPSSYSATDVVPVLEEYITVDRNKCMAFISLRNLSIAEIDQLVEEIKRSENTLVIKRKKALLLPYFGHSLHFKCNTPIESIDQLKNQIDTIIGENANNNNGNGGVATPVPSQVEYYFFDDNKSGVINFTTVQPKEMVLTRKSISLGKQQQQQPEQQEQQEQIQQLQQTLLEQQQQQQAQPATIITTTINNINTTNGNGNGNTTSTGSSSGNNSNNISNNPVNSNDINNNIVVNHNIPVNNNNNIPKVISNTDIPQVTFIPPVVQQPQPQQPTSPAINNNINLNINQQQQQQLQQQQQQQQQPIINNNLPNSNTSTTTTTITNTNNVKNNNIINSNNNSNNSSSINISNSNNSNNNKNNMNKYYKNNKNSKTNYYNDNDMKYVICTNLPKKVTYDILLESLKEQRYQVLFITIRDNIAYIELDKSSHNRLLSTFKFKANNGAWLYLEDGSNARVPYWNVYLFPIPEANYSAIANRISKFVSVNGPFRETAGYLEIPLGTEECRNELLKEHMILVQSFSYNKTNKSQTNNNAGGGKQAADNAKKGNYINHYTWVFEDTAETNCIYSGKINVTKTLYDNIFNKRRDLLNKVRSEHSVKVNPEQLKNDYFIEFSGPNPDKLTLAIEDMNVLMSSIKERRVDTPVINSHHRELFYKTLNEHCYKNKTVTNKGGERKGETTIICTTLFGPQEDIDQFANFLEDLQMDSFSLLIDGSKTNTIAIDAEQLSKEFNISIKMEPKQHTVHVCGPHEDVNNFEEWLESTRESLSPSKAKKEVTQEIAMTYGELFFFRRQLHNDIQASGVRVVLKSRSVFLNGENKKIQDSIAKIDQLKSQLESYRLVKLFSESTVKELDQLKEFFTKDEMVFIRHKIIKKKSKKLSKQPQQQQSQHRTTNGNNNNNSGVLLDSDDEDDDDNNDDNEDGNYSEKIVYVMLEFVGFKKNWDSVMAKIKLIESKEEGRPQEISNISLEEFNYLKNTFVDTNIHRGIHFNTPKRKLFINRLWKDDIDILVNQVILTITQHQLHQSQQQFQQIHI